MHNIIQIEELVYSRLPNVNKADWIEMLSKQGVPRSYATLLDDYQLIEQTDYRFDDGEYISSERTVFNIDYVTYDIEENAPNPDNTEVIVTVNCDRERGIIHVFHTHFLNKEDSVEDFAVTFSEADPPASLPSIQSPINEPVLSKGVSMKLISFTYNYYEFKWQVGDSILLDDLFSGPTTLIGNPCYQFRRKALFIFVKTDIVKRLGTKTEYEIPANSVKFMRKYQEKYSGKLPRIFIFVSDDGKEASFYDEVKLVRANKNSIIIKSLLRI